MSAKPLVFRPEQLAGDYRGNECLTIIARLAPGYSPTGNAVPPGVTPPSASYRIVTPDYRRTLGIPLLRGRDLTAADRPDAPPVGLVNETLARELWPGDHPIGKEVHFDDGSLWFTVVGVVGDVRQHRLDRAPGGEVYVPHAQDSWPSAMSIVVRARGEPAALVPLLREAVSSVDANVPIREVRSMEDVVHRSMTEPRTRALVFSGFAGLAFVLSAVGVYGVVAYTVSRTTRDIGIRIALGATGRRVLAQTLSASLGPVAFGMILGIVISVGSTSVLSSFLYGVEATDPAVYLTVGGALLAVALAAAYVPARRASRIDPVGSLRAEG